MLAPHVRALDVAEPAQGLALIPNDISFNANRLMSIGIVYVLLPALALVLGACGWEREAVLLAPLVHLGKVRVGVSSNANLVPVTKPSSLC